MGSPTALSFPSPPLCISVPFFLLLHLTHIPADLLSLFSLHLVTTRLPIPENKLSAWTRRVSKSNIEMSLSHTRVIAIQQARRFPLCGLMPKTKQPVYKKKCIVSFQGAIFLFFAGRIEEIKGNIDEVMLGFMLI